MMGVNITKEIPSCSQCRWVGTEWCKAAIDRLPVQNGVCHHFQDKSVIDVMQ